MQEQSLFIEALEKGDPAERAAFLDRACAGDPELRRRIERLLQRHGQDGSFLASPVPPLGATVDEPIREHPGTVIGPYKLLEQIGEGGFGVVFMAEQTEPVRRKVALKVLKPGMDTRQVVARFEAERQALALMDHPNIAKVFDGGAAESGRPYFVMELVTGVPITTYCDQHKLTPRQRLELFVPVCEAVQHAHQKGVIHRDLKPSNVLAALYDGRPVPKVIDFGVAKAAGQPLTEKTLFTGFGAVVGTLEYMSPEQAELNQLDIDTRSDIYSLGVLLYELLTGTTPLERKRLKDTGLLEALRLIREEETPRPSARLSTTAELPAVAASRGLEPKKLSGAIRGELDWIVMKALEKERDRRYESASAFAADVRRYLSDEPVLACPPSAWYRLRKFARRNKGRLAAAAVLGVALLAVGGTATGSIGWMARDREARRAKLTGQVELILGDVDRLEREEKWPEARAAVERAAAVLTGGEADDAVRRRVAEARRDLAFVAELDRIRQGRGATVEGHWNDAGAARDYPVAFRDYGVDVESLPVEEAVARLRDNPALAAPVALALSEWLEARRALGEGESNWGHLVAVARGIDADPVRNRLRGMWDEQVTPKLQAELRRLAESIDVKTQPPETLDTLASVLAQAQLPDVAVQILRDSRYAHPGDFWLNLGLARQLSTKKDFAGAVRYYSAAVAIRPESASAHTDLGSALHGQGNLDEAVAEHRKAIELDPKDAVAHLDLGNALRDQGKLDEAIAEYRKAIDCEPNFINAHGNLGLALRAQGDLPGAVAECRRTVELGPDDARAHNNLGLALGAQGDLTGAAAEFRKAIEIEPKDAPPHCNLGFVLYGQGKLDEAIAEYRKAVELKHDYAEAHGNLGNALGAQGDLTGAVAEYHKAIELDPKLAIAHYNLGVVLAHQGKLDAAIAEYKEAIALKPDHAAAHCNLGLALEKQGEFRAALTELRRGQELGSNNPGWPYRSPSAQWVRQCERLVELDGKLPDLLAPDKATAPSADERIELAQLCSLKQLHAAAARFYADAFAAAPKLANDLSAAHRYNAACAAALAGCGQGKDADNLDEKEKTRLRGQARDWLRADLKALADLPDKAAVGGVLKHWQVDPDLAGVRGTEALGKLPEAERQEWQKLWDDAAGMLAHAQAKATPEKKPDAK